MIKPVSLQCLNVNQKLFCRKGRKQVDAVILAESGDTITVKICMNVADSFMPPLFVLTRQIRLHLK